MVILTDDTNQYFGCKNLKSVMQSANAELINLNKWLEKKQVVAECRKY